MRIERIQLRQITMPLVAPFETSFGRIAVRHQIVVKVWSEGLVGWGESPALDAPVYCYETTETCWHVQRDFLVPSVLGRDVGEPGELAELFAPVRGHNIAKTGIEQACWDLFAKAADEPLARFLGGTKDRITSGGSIGILGSVDDLLAEIASFVEQGYRRIKMKVKPGWDLDVVQQVRERFPELPLMLDANSAYTLADVDLFKALDTYGLMMIEQPLAYDDIIEHAKLQSQLRTPICLDESITSPEHARWAIEMGSCRVINIKPPRVGGLYEARRVHDICQEHHVPVWCGGMIESGIGMAHNVAIGSLPNFRLPDDTCPSKRLFAVDTVVPPWEMASDGTIAVPTNPGIGVEVDEDLLEEITVREHTFST